MKVLSLFISCSVVNALVSAVVIEPTITEAPQLQKRYRKVRLPTTTSSTSTEPPKPWVRTIYETVAEIVTPTVIGGVTFSAKPPDNTDRPQPWVSLNKYGSPKTIKPEIKNGATKNRSPDYSTYFQTATTRVYDYEDLKAHNMDPDQVHEEVEYIDEDKTYVSLSPLIRCTPDRYTMQGIARDKSSAPFCTPHSGVELAMGKIYFITWFSRYFSDDVKKVRIHLSYVKESAKSKGMKRDVEHAFFTSEWLDNDLGFFPLDIQEEWFVGEFIRNVGMTIQPDNVSDGDFDLLTDATVFKIAKGNKVFKKTKQMKELEDEGITDDSIYYVILSIPSVIVVTALGMYIFLLLTKGDRDFTNTRRKAWKAQHKILGKFIPKKNNKKYTELPKFDDQKGWKVN